jgi:hypothetical protein
MSSPDSQPRYADLSEYRDILRGLESHVFDGANVLRVSQGGDTKSTLFTHDHISQEDPEGWTSHSFTQLRSLDPNPSHLIVSRRRRIFDTATVSVTSEAGKVQDFLIETHQPSIESGMLSVVSQIYPQRKLNTHSLVVPGLPMTKSLDFLCTRYDIGTEDTPKLFSLIFDPFSSRPVIQLVDGTYIDWDTQKEPFMRDEVGDPLYLEEGEDYDLEMPLTVMYREGKIPGGVSHVLFEYNRQNDKAKPITMSFPTILTSQWGETLYRALEDPLAHPSDIMQLVDEGAQVRLS